MAKETANNGWICLHRAMREWQWYDDCVIKAVFIDLLFSACTQPTWFKGRKIGRGQSVITIDSLVSNNGLSRPTVIKALRTLEDSGEITRTKHKFYVITTICNYAKYQDFGQKVSKNDLPTSLPTSLLTSLPNKQYNNNNKNDVVEINSAHAHEELIKDLFSRQITIEAFCKNEGITTDQCRKYAEAVVIEWQLTDESHNNRTQAIKHLLAQIRIKAQADRERGITFTDKSVRLQPMIDFCRELVAEGFNRQDVKDWYGYWTEECQDRTGRMRFEAEKTWNAKRRFNNYLKRKAQ